MTTWTEFSRFTEMFDPVAFIVDPLAIVKVPGPWMEPPFRVREPVTLKGPDMASVPETLSVDEDVDAWFEVRVRLVGI